MIQNTRLPILCVLFFLTALLPYTAHAAIRMEIGNQGIQFEHQGLSTSETGEQGRGDLIMQTPPRSEANNAQESEALPFGIVPEVLVPWHPPTPQPPSGPPKGGGLKPPQGAK